MEMVNRMLSVYLLYWSRVFFIVFVVCSQGYFPRHFVPFAMLYDYSRRVYDEPDFCEDEKQAMATWKGHHFREFEESHKKTKQWKVVNLRENPVAEFMLHDPIRRQVLIAFNKEINRSIAR